MTLLPTVTLYRRIETTPHAQLVAAVQSLIIGNPEARRYLTSQLDTQPIDCTGDPITPESIDADPTLTEQQKAEAYDMLFEYHGEEDEPETCDYCGAIGPVGLIHPNSYDMVCGDCYDDESDDGNTTGYDDRPTYW